MAFCHRTGGDSPMGMTFAWETGHPFDLDQDPTRGAGWVLFLIVWGAFCSILNTIEIRQEARKPDQTNDGKRNPPRVGVFRGEG